MLQRAVVLHLLINSLFWLILQLSEHQSFSNISFSSFLRLRLLSSSITKWIKNAVRLPSVFFYAQLILRKFILAVFVVYFARVALDELVCQYTDRVARWEMRSRTIFFSSIISMGTLISFTHDEQEHPARRATVRKDKFLMLSGAVNLEKTVSYWECWGQRLLTCRWCS